MSFSSDVKDEAARVFGNARHCQIAELAAIFGMNGKIMISEQDRYSLKIVTENVTVARKFYKLLKMAFDVNAEIAIHSTDHLNKTNVYTVVVRNHDKAERILKAIKLLDENLQINEQNNLANLITQQTCCKRAFIRGAFLISGSVNDPNKFYHLEIVCNSEERAIQLRDMINTFELDSKVVKRKKSYVVYIKEGTQIAEVLNIIEAHVSLMNFENVRILKDVRNSVNRKVNCEAANINKTIEAALKQIKDIEYIRDTVGLEGLGEPLCELAKVRLDNPDVPLKDLGSLLTVPVGKSGVNHRLKKISEIASELRGDKEE